MQQIGGPQGRGVSKEKVRRSPGAAGSVGRTWGARRGCAEVPVECGEHPEARAGTSRGAEVQSRLSVGYPARLVYEDISKKNRRRPNGREASGGGVRDIGA